MTQNAAQALNEIRRLFEGLLAGAYGASDAEDAETGRAPAQGASPVRDTGPAQDADPAHDAEAGPPARSTLPDAFAARGAEQALTEDGQAQLSEKAESEPSVKTAATDQKKDPVDFGFVLKAAHGGETAPAVAGNEGPDAPAAAARQAFDSIVEKITSMRNASQQEMEISLKPEFLGRVVIRLSMDGDALVAKIAASDPKVQDAFLAQANALQSSLAEQGLKDVRVVVTSAFVPDASLQQQAEGRAQERYGRGRRNAVVVDAAEPAASPSPLSAYEQVFRTGQINCLA
jgi:flagellar hook-length control protein FliK